jgi:phage terminase large subunit-like protein
MIGIGTIFRRRAGSGGPLPPDYAKWVKEHMVFWYDMSKPVDVYVPGVTYTNPFVNLGGKITYDKTINKCIITHTPTNNANTSFWQIMCLPLQSVDSYRIKVTGLPEGFTIKGRLGYGSIQITQDGEYDIKSYTNSSSTNTSYPGFYLAGDNVNDVDCNIVVEEIPTKQSVPTNEILKANPYLQDFSGNNRPLKLNNFLFAAMSGVGGYTLNAKSYHNRSNIMVGTFGDYSIEITAKVTDILGIVWTKNGVGDSNSVAVGETLTRPAFTITVEGMPDDLKWGMYESGGANKGNGTFEIPAYTYTNNTETVKTKFVGLTFSQNTFDNVDIKFTFQPLYPNALVTDGVDDYGVVENLQQGVKMLFYTCNPFSLNKIFYDQTKQGWRKFNIYNQTDKIAYNERNENGVTYIDGNLNSLLLANDLVNKKQIITIVNEGSDANNTISPIYFSVNQHNGYFANLAFYNSIGFDSVPTKQNDGFTEQELIDYVLENIITQ